MSTNSNITAESPPQVEAARMNEDGDPSGSRTPAGPDLENRLRELILNNGIPEALKPVSSINEASGYGSTMQFMPPHLRSAPIAEQQKYLRQHQTQVNAPKPTVSRTSKGTIQTGCKRGAKEKADITLPLAPSHQVFPNMTQHDPHSVRGQSSTGLQRPFPQAVSTNGVPSGDHSHGGTGTRTPSKPQSGFESFQKPSLQLPQKTVASKEGSYVPEKGQHQLSRKLPSSSKPNNRPLNNQNYVAPKKMYSQGNQKSQAHANGNAQRMNRQQPSLHNQNNYTAPGTSLVSATQSPKFTRPPIPPNRQLFNPNSQHLDVPSQLNISVPGPMRANYLDSLAACEIPKAEITPQELQEKEALRFVLHELCKQEISAFETAKDVSFDSETVALKCFGSLSSGYATRGSDMDLVLVSPKSTPDAASAESEIPRLLEKVLLDKGYGARLLTRTRVPIIRFCEKPTQELLQALKDNRSKWEKERDLPPKPKHKKKEFNGRSKKQTKENDSMLEKAETRSAAPGELSGAPIVVRLPIEDKKGVQGHHFNSESAKVSEVETRSVGPCESLSAAIVVRLPIENNNQNESRLRNRERPQKSLNEENKSEESQHSEQQDPGEGRRAHQTVDTDTQDQKTLTAGKQPQKPPLERTDEELVRLYILAMTEGWFSEEERGVIYRFVNIVKQPKGRNPTELTESRFALKDLPDVLSRYREKAPDLHLDFPKDGVGIQCDINFSNFLALHNTLLLRCYSHCDPRIRPMILFVKAWAKKRKINSPYHGTLSSYGYVLMVLHYVVNIASPPLAPNLQMAWKAPPYEKPEEIECQGCNVRFWRSEKEIRRAADRGLLTTNRQSLGSLLRGFFQYFAQEVTDYLGTREFLGHGFSWSYNVLSLRTHGGILTKREKGWTGARTETIEPTVAGQEAREVKHRYLFAIEDPFEIDHNVARPVVHHGIVAIRDEFRRANKLIMNAGYSNGLAVDLFEEGTEHVQERSFFGPNPARFNRPKRFGPQKPSEDTGGNTPDRQRSNNAARGAHGSGKLEDVSPMIGDPTAHGVANRGLAAAYGKAEEINHIQEQVAEAVDDQNSTDNPDSPLSLKEDVRG